MKKLTRSKIVKKLDAEFSRYIRLKYADHNGYVKCYTCKRVKHYKDSMQCGHFLSRRYYSTRWSEDNCRPQCYGCNVHSQGRQYEYALNLNKEYGYDIAEELLQISRETVKISTPELLEKIEYYKVLNKGFNID
ncbi:MAG: recombination protein NinG [Gammaproteobacteria bacterium]|nr:recombination protein NinG [Gammaproteobacteria bacterium]